MSHNLTDRELNDLIAAAVAVAEAMSPEERAAMMEQQRQSWVRGEQALRRPTESVSPPRVPVDGEPGQPTDLTIQLENDASGWEQAALAADEYDRAPEGMCETAALERTAAAEIRRLREQVKTEHRAGIEAAAKWHDKQADYCDSFSGGGWHLHSQRDSHREYAAAIRALADQPAPNLKETKQCE